MMSTTIGTTAATTATGTAAGSAARANLAMDEQKFLQLLTTQLRNQDPTQPMDANAMTQQLAQFSAVEQQVSTNTHLTSLIALQQSTALVAAAPLVGQQAEITTDRIALQGGAAAPLRLPAVADAAGATRARIVVTDAAGNPVREATVPLTGESQGWTWDGRNSRGAQVADGSYRVAVAGLDTEGATRGVLQPTMAGRVTAISRGDNEPLLSLGGVTVPLSALRRTN
jgi:flagellar basal-body rod modification protein FlgD